jgi:hypothetical protein
MGVTKIVDQKGVGSRQDEEDVSDSNMKGKLESGLPFWDSRIRT